MASENGEETGADVGESASSVLRLLPLPRSRLMVCRLETPPDILDWDL